jgi:hypothetical protein
MDKPALERCQQESGENEGSGLEMDKCRKQVEVYSPRNIERVKVPIIEVVRGQVTVIRGQSAL